ncbi:hypothetical protein [Thiofaba sp. EF100]|uniref:hypothetical protein n=1 Tax=Thiofaba sp. EF100 TaxID=3121274 RepID=UPI00322187E8
MAEILTAHVLNAPAQLQEHLAVRLTGDPGRDADALCALLEEGQVARLRAKERLASLETVWPSAVDALNQIEQRVASNSIPLSSHMAGMAASHARLAQALLGLFQQEVEDLHDSREPWWGISKRQLALTRAADLLTRIGLMCRLIYVNLPPNFWQRFHALLLEGERTRHMQDHLESRHGEHVEPSLEERYIAFALLEMSIPDGLPHQEIRPLYQCFLDLAGRTRIVPVESLPEDVFIHFDLKDDRPPELGMGQRPLQSGSMRTLRLAPVLEALDGLLAAHPHDHISLGDGGAMLSRGTLERTRSLLRERARRHVHRQTAEGRVRVWAGRNSILRKLGERAGNKPAASADMHILREGIDSPPDETLHLPPQAERSRADELWDRVAHRHLVEGRAVGFDRGEAGAPPPSAASVDTPMEWRLVDVSPGGLHLRSQGGIADHLNMGEPVLVEFPQGAPGEEVIGILRWLHTPADQIMDMGLEIIAHSAVPLRVSGAGCNTTVWFDALLLTRSRLADGPLLLLPNHDYKTGDHVVTLRGGDSTPMRLGERMLQTVAVAIFRCCSESHADAGQDPARTPCRPLIDEKP